MLKTDIRPYKRTFYVQTVIEIPYKFQQRTEGESKLSGKVTLEYLKQLKDLRKRYNKANKYQVEIWSTERMMAE